MYFPLENKLLFFFSKKLQKCLTRFFVLSNRHFCYVKNKETKENEKNLVFAIIFGKNRSFIREREYNWFFQCVHGPLWVFFDKHMIWQEQSLPFPAPWQNLESTLWGEGGCRSWMLLSPPHPFIGRSTPATFPLWKREPKRVSDGAGRPEYSTGRKIYSLNYFRSSSSTFHRIQKN